MLSCPHALGVHLSLYAREFRDRGWTGRLPVDLAWVGDCAFGLPRLCGTLASSKRGVSSGNFLSTSKPSSLLESCKGKFWNPCWSFGFWGTFEVLGFLVSLVFFGFLV